MLLSFIGEVKAPQSHHLSGVLVLTLLPLVQQSCSLLDTGKFLGKSSEETLKHDKKISC